MALPSQVVRTRPAPERLVWLSYLFRRRGMAPRRGHCLPGRRVPC